MEIALILVLIVLVIILLTRSTTTHDRIMLLIDKVVSLSKNIRELEEQIEKLKTNAAPAPFLLQAPPEPLKAEESPVKEPLQKPQPIMVEELVKPILEQIREELQHEQLKEEKPVPEPIPVNEVRQPAYAYEQTPPQQNYPFEEKESWFDKWFRNNPDLEKFIGENLINKIGIAVLVLGIAFFVKYAIDKDWINETGRVCIGLGCGLLLVLVAHYLRKNYRAFSSVLCGGGIAVFYFTIAFAYQQYRLMPQTAAFITMVVITAFAVALSLVYDKIELAVIAAVGGFITPFLLSNGSGDYVVLFSYLIILNVGLLSLAYFKRWPLINTLSLFFTILIYGGWMIKTFSDISDNTTMGLHVFPYANALIFASVFYLIFLAMNMVHQLKNASAFRAFDFSILLLITSGYYASGMVITHNWNNGQYQGLFTVSLAIVNFCLAWYLFKRKGTDRNLLYLLIGLALSFISLAAPVQLHGHSITLFWCAEFVLLFWLYQKSGIRLFRYSSFLITILSIISLLIDWEKASNSPVYHLAVIFTGIQGIATNIVAVIALGLYTFLLKKEDMPAPYIAGTSNKSIQRLFSILALLIFYLTCVYGVNLFFGHMSGYAVPNVYHRIITGIFALALSIFIQTRHKDTYPWSQVYSLALCFLFYLFSLSQIYDLRAGVLMGNYPMSHFFMHWLSDLLLLYLFYKVLQYVRSKPDIFNNYYRPISWILSLSLLALFSVELAHIYVVIGYKGTNTAELVSQYQKVGLTVLWGICSFTFMLLGMIHRYKTIRIISLCLFTVTLLKLFIYDISDISETGKIIAFIILGVILLAVSFMYQKLKKIIIDDHKE